MKKKARPRRQRRMARAAAVLGVLLLPFCARAGLRTNDLPVIPIPEVSPPPVIDGRLDDACWADAYASAPLKDEYAYAVHYTTTFHVCQSPDTLYLGIRATFNGESPGFFNYSTNHDGSLWMGEGIEIFIDPDLNDTWGYYQLAITPDGLTGDWYHTEPADGDCTWEPDYAVAVWKTNTEWTAEYALPVSCFDRTATFYENFGLNICRQDGIYWEPATASPMRSEGYHVPHRFCEARGMTGTGVTVNVAGTFPMPYVKTNAQVITAIPDDPLMTTNIPVFAREPTAVSTPDGLEIAFEADRITDVAVWIETPGGTILKHLVAGRLGPNPPPPLQAGALAQELTWDGLDDWGNPVADPSDCRVRIGLGSRAHLDKVIGWTPAPQDICGIAIDTTGTVYLVGGERTEWTELQTYHADGSYRCTLLPTPGDVPAEQLKGLNLIDFGPDGQVRFGSRRLGESLPHLDQPMPHRPLVNSMGQVILFGTEYPSGPGRFYKINADGSIPVDWMGPYVKDVHWVDFYELWAKRFHFALDPSDESLIYLSGIKETHRLDYAEDLSKNRMRFYNAVCRIRWDDRAPMEVFAGELNMMGTNGSSAAGEFFDPRGICFDAHSNLWVCDYGNDRVQIFDHDGQVLRQFASPGPTEIAVSRKTGQSYVMGTDAGQVYITKYSADPAPSILARSSSLGSETAWRSMALDESGSATEIKIVKPNGTSPATTAQVVERIVDLGTTFSAPETIIGQDPRRNYDFIAVGWTNDILSAGGYWFDGNTGAYLGQRAPDNGGEIAASRDGTWVMRSGFWPLYLSVYPADWPWNPSAAPLKHWQVEPPALSRNGRRGVTVAPNGDIYLLRYYQFQYKASGRASEESPALHVACDVYSPTGALKSQRVIYELSQAGQAPAVDINGNIYVVDNHGRALEQLYEPDIASNLPAWVQNYDLDWDAVRNRQPVACGTGKFVFTPLLHAVGTLYKFGPSGGGLLWRAGQGDWIEHTPQPGATLNDGYYLDWGYPSDPMPAAPATHWSAKWVGIDRVDGIFPQWQDGVEWEFLGVAPAWGRYNLAHSSCCCGTCRISVDDFGRVYAPAAHRNTVRMIDTAGNELLRIGRYANMDSYGPDSPVPEVEIGLRFPCATALSQKHLYISEWRYGRVLRVSLDYKTERTLVPVDMAPYPTLLIVR